MDLGSAPDHGPTIYPPLVSPGSPTELRTLSAASDDARSTSRRWTSLKPRYREPRYLLQWLNAAAFGRRQDNRLIEPNAPASSRSTHSFLSKVCRADGTKRRISPKENRDVRQKPLGSGHIRHSQNMMVAESPTAARKERP